jgi:hypothetical protein
MRFYLSTFISQITLYKLILNWTITIKNVTVQFTILNNVLLSIRKKLAAVNSGRKYTTASISAFK